MPDPAIAPFRIAIPDAELGDLRERLRRARWPEVLDDPAWEYGIEQGALQDLARYWAEQYDWRKHEAELNRFPQFTTEIEGQGIHFLHVRSPHEDATPLVVTHGWPGSFVEFRHVIEPLTHPTEHGGEPGDAFHVVCPSLPGYGFSQPNTAKGWDAARTGKAWGELMRRLGYERYAAQGGDWGSFVSQETARFDPEHCFAIHLNFVFTPPPSAEALAEMDEEAAAMFVSFQHYVAEESGYAQIQGTKPQTLGYALHDSPVGQLAWIAEKFRSWTDCDGVIENAISRDDLLTNVSVYWFTGTGGSSARFYREQRVGGGLEVRPKLEAPLGVASFPKEVVRAPRAWIETKFDVRHWTDMPKGGHFAAMEQPELLVEDIRAFFRSLG
ncbi:MAG: epoxide hydrolase family protein [Myxococcota bacterium]